MVTFGERLRELRKKSKLTVKKVAEDLELSPRMITFLETNDREPNLETINKIGKYFNCSTDYLLGNTDDPRPISEIAEDLTEYFMEISDNEDFDVWKSIRFTYGEDVEDLSEEDKETLTAENLRKIFPGLWGDEQSAILRKLFDIENNEINKQELIKFLNYSEEARHDNPMFEIQINPTNVKAIKHLKYLGNMAYDNYDNISVDDFYKIHLDVIEPDMKKTFLKFTPEEIVEILLNEIFDFSDIESLEKFIDRDREDNKYTGRRREEEIKYWTDMKEDSVTWSIKKKIQYIGNFYLDNEDHFLEKLLSYIEFKKFINKKELWYIPDKFSPMNEMSRTILTQLNIKNRSLDEFDKIFGVFEFKESGMLGEIYEKIYDVCEMFDDSMIMNGIVKGSSVKYDKTDTVESGKLALITIKDNIVPVVRRIFDHGDTYFLQTSNPKFPSENISKADVEILGLVKKVEWTIE